MILCDISFLFHYLLREKEAKRTGQGLSDEHLGGTWGTLNQWPALLSQSGAGWWVWEKEQGRQSSVPDLGCLVAPAGCWSTASESEQKTMLQSQEDPDQTLCPWGWVPKPLPVLPKGWIQKHPQVSIANPCCLSYWQSHRGQKSKIWPRRQQIPRHPLDQFILQAWHTHAAGLGILEMLANTTQHIHLGCRRHIERWMHCLGETQLWQVYRSLYPGTETQSTPAGSHQAE